MKVIVTGGAGFIGSHLCEALLKRGDQVVAIDNFDPFYDPEIKRRNIHRCLAESNFAVCEGDIRDSEFIENVLGTGADAVVHLAARAGVRPSIADPMGYLDVNVRGTGVLLEAVRKNQIKNIVIASSSSVYGNNKKVPFSEDDPVDHPISPYASTKKACEVIAHTYHHLYDINTFCLRFFTVYGPRQRPDLAIHKFASLIEEGKPIPVFGDGSMERDFTYIDDIIAGVLASIDRCSGYRIYNLGESRPIALRHMIGEIEEALGKKAIIDRHPVPPGDVQRTYADVSKACRDLGYVPATELADGLAKFVAWFRASS